MKFAIGGNFNVFHKRKMLEFKTGEVFDTTDKELIEKLKKAKQATETKAK